MMLMLAVWREFIGCVLPTVHRMHRIEATLHAAVSTDRNDFYGKR
jgi:hypothetical protein